MLQRLARIVVTYPIAVVAVVLALSVGLGSELRHLQLEVKLSDMMPRGHPYIRIDHRLSQKLGVQQTSLLAIGVHHGDIFNPKTLRKIRTLTEAVSRLPGVVPSSVLSIAARRVKSIRGDAEGLRVDPLLPDPIPTDPAALRRLRAETLSYPMYVGNLVTPDGRGAMILADFPDTVPAAQVNRDLEMLASQQRDADTEILVGGQSPALAALNQATRGIVPLMLLALVVVGLVHYEAFRTVQAVVLPLVTAGLSVVWAMGITGLLGYAVTPWTAVTAVLVLAVAAGHAVQILKRYYEFYHDLGDNREAVEASLLRIGPVLATACGVAAAGFASLATFGVPAVRDFGLIAAFGILSALVLELTLIPAVRVLLRAPRSAEATRESSHHFLHGVLDSLERRVLRQPRGVIAVVVLSVLLISVGIFRVRVNTAFRSWFSRRNPVIVADREIRKHFTGTSTIRVLVEGKEPDSLLNPRVVRGIAALQHTLAAEPEVTGTLSIADYVQVMNRAMNGGKADAYRIPDSRALISQYLLLFGPRDLTRVLSPDGRTAAIYALARSDNVHWVEGLFAKLRKTAAGRFPRGIHVGIAGGELAQAAAVNESVVREKIENMIQVSLVIVLLSALVFRSLAAGLLVLAPLACAALVNVGAMGWIGSDLSFATATYTAMGVSLGADFAIYLLFRLREEARVRPLPEAVEESLRTSGRAVFFVASAIAAGNATLCASSFQLWRELGGYVALMMTTSCLATLTLLPALVLRLQPRFLREVAEATRPGAGGEVADAADSAGSAA